jgi:hypothetical protein
LQNKLTRNSYFTRRSAVLQADFQIYAFVQKFLSVLPLFERLEYLILFYICSKFLVDFLDMIDEPIHQEEVGIRDIRDICAVFVEALFQVSNLRLEIFMHFLVLRAFRVSRAALETFFVGKNA